MRIAEALSDLGVDVIEAGFPVISVWERTAIKRIVALGLKPRICGLARCRKEDIDAAIDCGLDYVHTFIATSKVHMEHKLKMTPEQVMAKGVESVEYAKSHGLTVEFSCEDATRTELPFLKEMHLAVQAAKVDKINMPDTVGTMSPPAMEYLVREVMPVTKVPLSLHCHDDFGLAVATRSRGALRGAADHVCVTARGAGGNAALEEVILGLMAFYGTRTSIRQPQIGYVSSWCQADPHRTRQGGRWEQRSRMNP
jgi:2-isopropylmalate synthase